MLHTTCRPGLIVVAAIVFASMMFCADANAVTVTVVPADTTVDIGEMVTLRVETDTFLDLKAYELIFGFDPAFVELVDVTAGDVLTGASGSFVEFVRDEFAAPLDSVWYDAAVLDGSTQGPGILAFFRFKAVAEGDSPILCRLIDFRDSLNQQTLPACVGGIIRVTGPVQAVGVTWGSLKAIYR